MWTRQSRRRGPRFVLLVSTLALGLYPILLSVSSSLAAVIVISALNATFQAALNLVFFDRLLQTVPPARNETYLAVAQSFQYLAMTIGPLIGSFISDQLTIVTALMIAGVIRIISFVFFVADKPVPRMRAESHQAE